MIDFKFLPSHFCLSLLAGILVGYFVDFNIKWIAITLIILLVLLVLSYFDSKKRYSVPIMFVLLTNVILINLGIFLSLKSKPRYNDKHFSHFVAPNAVFDISIVEEMKHSNYYWKYTGFVNSVNTNQTKGLTIIRIKKVDKNRPLSLNDRFLTSGSPAPIPLPLNPGAFDYNQYMKRKGIYDQFTLEKSRILRRNSKNKSTRIKALQIRALEIRDRILSSLRKRGISKREFSIIQALLLGQKTGLSQETLKDYQNAGAMHILAISGLHIGILMMILKFLLKPIGRIKFGKQLQWVLLALSLWSFAFVLGLSPSVVRAVSMFTLLSVGLSFGRSLHLSNYLFIGLFFSLLVNPLLVFDLGFQLSYTAVFAIIGMGPFIKNLWSPKHKVLKYLWELSVVSISAQFGVLPLTLFYFHHFSSLFLLSSICVIPLLGFVLGLGYLMLLLNGIGLLGESYIRFYEMVIKTLNFIIENIGALDRFSFHDVFFSLTLLPITYGLIVTMTYWVRYPRGKQTLRLLAAGLLLFGVLLFKKWSTQNTSEFVVFHQFKQSLFINRGGDKVLVLSNAITDSILQQRSIKDYNIEYLNLEFEVSELNQNFFEIAQKRVMVVDHTSAIIDIGFNPEILILVNSPKLNMERLLENIKPRLVVADGSNFYSLKSVWEKTAKKQGILFHDTAKQGAFTIMN